MRLNGSSLIEHGLGRVGVHGWRRSGWFLGLVILVASLVVRIIALYFWGTGAIESEGAEYARIAQNLRNGVGYVGIVTSGPELMFPPLLPLLIAGTSFVTNNYLLAGRLVSFALGTFLPLAMFGIASTLFNWRVAWLAAILTIFHPLFISLSFTVLTEGPYATLLMSALYIVSCALDYPSILRLSAGIRAGPHFRPLS